MSEYGSDIPRGIEVLVKKASVDPEFKDLLMNTRAEAARAIGLQLDPAEEVMLRAITEEQLAMSIAQASVPQEQRRAFLGKAAAAMLAAIGVMGPGAAASLAMGKRKVGGGGGGGIRVDVPRGAPTGVPQRRFPDVDRDVEAQVIDIVAKQLGHPKEQISWGKELVKDLKVDAPKCEAIRKALEASLDITLPAATFRNFGTVEDAAHHVHVATTRRRRNDALAKQPVIDAITKEMKIDDPNDPFDRSRITGSMRLAKDLKMTTAQKARLKRALATQLHVYISWPHFKELVTVRDVIDHVAEAVEKRRGAQRPRTKSKIPPGQMTFGNRPDVPDMSAGTRPSRPPAGPLIPQRDPFEEAEQLRRRYGK